MPDAEGDVDGDVSPVRPVKRVGVIGSDRLATPEDHTMQRGKRPAGALGTPIELARIVFSIVALSMLLGCSGSGGPSVLILDIGTGVDTAQSGCELTGKAATFDRDDDIVAVLTFDPPLPAGGTATVTVERDGTLLPDLGDTVTVPEPAECVFFWFGRLEPGDYGVAIAVDPSAMPAISGGFDVTP